MSAKPRFDDSVLVDVLGDRARRVRLVAQVAQALLRGELPARDAALFTGGALLSWLENGGDLARDYLKVVKPKSHRTPAAIWQEMRPHQDEDSDIGVAGTVGPTSPESSPESE